MMGSQHGGSGSSHENDMCNTTDEYTVYDHGKSTSVNIGNPSKEDRKAVDQHFEGLTNCGVLGKTQTQGTRFERMLETRLQQRFALTYLSVQRVRGRLCWEVLHHHFRR